MTVKMTSVKSTSIEQIGYKYRTMHVKFHNGKAYEFKRVPRAKYDEFSKASSKGKFFNEQVKETYPFSELV